MALSGSGVLRADDASGTTIATFSDASLKEYQAIVLVDATPAHLGVSANPLYVQGAALTAIQAAVETIDNMISGGEAQVDIVSGPTGASALEIQGTAADGAAAVGDPVQVGGLDGSDDARALRTNSDGHLQAASPGSSAQSFAIGNGADGSAVTPADLGANYKMILVRCEDCSNIQASTQIRLQVGEGASDTVCDVYEVDDAGSRWESGNMPTSGTFRIAITHAFGARRVRIIMSENSSGGTTTFSITGVDRIN